MSRSSKHQAVLNAVGSLIRDARTSAGISQQAVADLFDWQRDALSKLERGNTDISLYSFLIICDFLREFLPPDHPALALYESLTPGRQIPRRRAD